MKKLLLITLILCLTGCAFLRSQKANWEACKEDSACVEQAKSWQDKTETASVLVASAIPVPGAAAVPKVLGYVALGLAMLIGGRAIRKKKEESIVNP